MKKFLPLAILTLAIAVSANSQAWASGANDWADSVIANSQGAFSFPNDPTNALGAADFTNSSIIPKEDTFYNLGNASGFLTVGFSNAVVLGEGIDLEVYEIGWQESMQIRLPDNSVWSPIVLSSEKGLRTANPDDRVTVFGFDFGNSGQWNQFTLFGGDQSHGGSNIDAIHGLTVTPEPVSVALFLIGGTPIALSLYRRRKFTV